MREAAFAAGTAAVFASFAVLAAPPYSVLFGHLALSFAVLAIVYRFEAPRLFGKRRHGGLHPISWLVLLPVHLLDLAATRLASRRIPATSQVLPQIFIGRRLTRREARELLAEYPRLGVIDLAAELPECRLLRGKYYYSVPALDRRMPSEELLYEALKRISKFERLRRPLLIHCALGNGRSAALLAAHLICTGRAHSPGSALGIIRRTRPSVDFSAAQRKALEQFTERFMTTP